MSWLSDFIGSSPVNMDFGYDPALSAYQEYGGMGDIIGGLQGLGGLQGQGDWLQGRAQDIYGMSQDMFAGTSPYLQMQRQRLKTGLGDVGAQQAMLGTRALAQRGVGGGGIRSLLGGMADARMGEQYRQGLTDIAGLGFQTGQGLMQTGLGYSQAGIGAYGQAGTLGAGISGRRLQEELANVAAQNQATQFDILGEYQQDLENRGAKAGAFSTLVGGITGLAEAGAFSGLGKLLGGGAGAGGAGAGGAGAGAAAGGGGISSLLSGLGGGAQSAYGAMGALGPIPAFLWAESF